MRLWVNPNRTTYGPAERAVLGRAHAQEAMSLLRRCPVFAPTLTVPLPGVAATAAVASVHVKDDGDRMGLGSFKALGGAYAVIGLGGSAHTVTCASAGNHGLSVAAGAKVAGIRAVIHISDRVSTEFERRLTDLGAEVRRSGAEYADSMEAAGRDARQDGWALVADSAWEGYTEIPRQVMRGYTVTAAEACEALGEPATHVFVQAGVGGLAAAVAGYIRDVWGEGPKIVVVEPTGSDCLLRATEADHIIRIPEGRTTLGRLDCGEPSLLAWRLLRVTADAFRTITDASADNAAARAQADGVGLSACGAAGIAGLLACAEEPDARAALGMDATSRVLVFGSEGATP